MKRIVTPALVVLVGPSGSGKSAWAAENFASNEIVSSDELRAAVGLGPYNQKASKRCICHARRDCCRASPAKADHPDRHAGTRRGTKTQRDRVGTEQRHGGVCNRLRDAGQRVSGPQQAAFPTGSGEDPVEPDRPMGHNEGIPRRRGIRRSGPGRWGSRPCPRRTLGPRSIRHRGGCGSASGSRSVRARVRAAALQVRVGGRVPVDSGAPHGAGSCRRGRRVRHGVGHGPLHPDTPGGPGVGRHARELYGPRLSGGSIGADTAPVRS